jgi:hypothetical protein
MITVRMFDNQGAYVGERLAPSIRQARRIAARCPIAEILTGHRLLYCLWGRVISRLEKTDETTMGKEMS